MNKVTEEKIKNKLSESSDLASLTVNNPPTPELTPNAWKVFNIFKMWKQWLSYSEISQRTGLYTVQIPIYFGHITEAGYVVEQHPTKIMFRLKHDEKGVIVRKVTG